MRKFQKLIIMLLPLYFIIAGECLIFAGTPIQPVKKEKTTKHYFPTNGYFNYYSTPKKNLSRDVLDLGTYRFQQYNTGFYTPLFTKDYSKNGGTTIANLHVLLTGHYSLSIPSFSKLENDHQLSKAGLGFRIIYNNGKKNIWFFSTSPYVTRDNLSELKGKERSSSTFVFNRTASDKFSWRIGYTNTYMFGDRLFLPILGFRYGRLDRSYLSVQFPRNISVYFPIRKTITGRIYTQPFGSVYNFANTDSIYNGDDKMLHFGRYEVNTGMSVDFKIHPNFSFFVGSGVSIKNYIGFSSFSYNKGIQALKPFYTDRAASSFYINFGLSFRFGRTKKINNNYSLYDAVELNNSFATGDESIGTFYNQIPGKVNESDIKHLQYKDIKDLIDPEDLY